MPSPNPSRLLPWVIALVTGLFLQVLWAEAHPAVLVGKEVLVAGATPGVHVNAQAFYRSDQGVEMLCRYGEQTKSDQSNKVHVRVSDDNGRTWKQIGSLETHWPVEGGTLRRGLHPLFADTGREVQLTFINQGVFPNDDPLEGMWRWTVRYGLSRDGGQTFFHEAQVVQKGEGYDEVHPLEGVWVGKTSYMLGDHTCYPIRISTGEILQPVQITPAGPDGNYINPGNGYTYHDSAVLIGTWNETGTLDWDLSERVVGDPSRSSRGMLEPTLAEFPDGRILMVLRGSNDNLPGAPSHRWRSISEDQGRTWSDPEPWTYEDGTAFFSPSSCSYLLPHSSGRTFWIGNISPRNPKGNSPRYPLVIGEVDPRTLLLVKESIGTLDDRGPGDWERLNLSNFFAHEDRVSHEIVVYCSPLFRRPPALADQPLDWSSDAYRYRVRVTGE